RINASIKNVLRIYKGLELGNVIQKIEINLNLTYHSMLKASLFEMLQSFSVFDIKNRDLSTLVKSWKIKDKRIKSNELKKMNKSRKDAKIIKDGYAMRKNVVQDKILDKILGPFKIHELNLEKENIWLDKGNIIVRHNIKNIKPFVGGG
ncbi:hypothetical protein DMUE_6383, partial [Dictyocoela muelleri]